MGATERDAACDVVAALAADEQGGTAVDHRVVHRACLVVARIVRAGDAIAEVGELAVRVLRK